MAAFFEHQDRARRNTSVLVGLMALAVLGMGGALYTMLALIGPSVGPLIGRTELAQLGGAGLFAGCVLGTAGLVVVASAGRMLSLRGGGAQVAESLGGRLISGSPRDGLERRLLNVVEEMAIASGVPVPQTYVMEAEDTINAFAAGYSIDDAAVAVTRGALEKLTRDELQGVIAHEFSHVLNGDMRLNLKLMGVVYGIVCVGLLGRFLMRVGSGASRGRRGGGGLPALFGFGVYLIGLVGELFGKLIKAAVSRQREFLADASAVQFTRNPGGIGGALKKIGGIGSPGSEIRTVYAEEASHFFFGEIKRRLVPGSVFATHPPLAERIARIDPSFRGEFPEVTSGIAEPESELLAGLAAPGASGAGGTTGAGAATHAVRASAVIAHVGTASAEALDEGRRLFGNLPPALVAAAESPFSACAIVYAMLLSEEPSFLERQIDELDRLAGAKLRMETTRLGATVRALSRRDRLPLVELCAPALRQQSPDQRAAFVRAVQALIEVDRNLSIFEYVLGHTVRERLAPKTAAAARPKGGGKSLKAVRTEVELVLSLLAHAGAAEAGAADRAFAAGAGRVSGLALTLLKPTGHLLPALGTALAALRSLPPRASEQVVDACAHAVLADRRVTDDEATLLRAVCDALGCPLPPVIVAQAA
jgi:Zn-dependent protease with chaperone function